MSFDSSAQDLENILGNKPVSVTGRISAGLSSYHTSRTNPRYQPFSYTLSASTTINLYGVSIPFSVLLSEKQRSFRQPFNKVGLSPTYKWLKVHLGHRNVHFSQYTLGGHTFLGGGIELTPGILRFGFVAGRFNRRIEDHPTNELIRGPEYARTGYSLKLGVGSAQNYFDLILFKANDKALSRDTAQFLQPAENLVLGIKTYQRLGNHINFEIDAAASAFSDDLSSAELDVDFPLQEPVSKVFLPRNSTRISFAGHALLNFNYQGGTTRLSYKRIDPEYRSMGTYFFLGDIEEYAISQSLALLRNKWRITGRIGIQRNNLFETKLQDNRRRAVSINTTIVASPQVNLTGSYSNFNSELQTVRDEFVSDSFNFIQVSENLRAGCNIRLKGQHRSTIFISAYTQSFDNLTALEGFNQGNKTLGATLSYNFKHAISELGLGGGFTYSTSSNAVFSNRRIGVNIRASKSFEAFDLKTSLGTYSNQLNGAQDGLSLSGKMQASYNLGKGKTLSLRFSYLNRHSNLVSTRSFSEVRGHLSYGMSL